MKIVSARPNLKFVDIFELFKNQQYSYIYNMFARETFVELIKEIGIKNCTVALPALMCDSITSILDYHNIDYILYDVGLEFDIEDSFIALIPDVDIVLLVHYFGFFNEAKILRSECKKNGVHIIEDFSHSFGCYHLNFAKNPMSFTCCRKFFPTKVSGFSYILQKNEVLDLNKYREIKYIFERMIEFVFVKILRINIYSDLASRLKDRLRSKQHNGVKADRRVSYFTSRLTDYFLGRTSELEKAISKIIMLYEHYVVLADQAELDIYRFKITPSDVPQWFVLKHVQANIIVEKLRSRGIGAICWPGNETTKELLTCVKKYPSASSLATSLILLPLNFRLNKTEVEYIIGEVTQIIAEV